MALLRLIWRAWPLIVPMLVLGGWWLLGWRLDPLGRPNVSKYAGVFLQLLGGLIAAYSVLANFALVRGQKLGEVFRAYKREFGAWWRAWGPPHVIVGATGVASATMAGMLTSGRARSGMTVEERLAELELLVRELTAALEREKLALNQKIEAVDHSLRSSLATQSADLSKLRQVIDDLNAGGFKLLLMGALLAGVGTFMGLFA